MVVRADVHLLDSLPQYKKPLPDLYEGKCSLDLSLAGRAGSKTDVVELQYIAPPQMLRKFLEGSKDEIAQAILKIIKEAITE